MNILLSTYKWQISNAYSKEDSTATVAKWFCITPFGAPVLPLVLQTSKVSSFGFIFITRGSAKLRKISYIL